MYTGGLAAAGRSWDFALFAEDHIRARDGFNKILASGRRNPM
jgi:hypothetical protein